MIIAIVRFKLPDDLSPEQATKMFEASAPRYKGIQGLKRKHYLLGQGYGGGAYLWNSREEAEKLYDQAWREGIKARFGSDPELTYYDTPVTVEN